jgi:hypothetical protein
VQGCKEGQAHIPALPYLCLSLPARNKRDSPMSEPEFSFKTYFFWLWRIPFPWIWNSRCWYEWRRGECLSPHDAPALSDDPRHLFGSYRIGGATAAGVKPPWAFGL